MEETTYTALILNIPDNVLRQIINENSSLEVWKKLHPLYDKKDLPNKIYIQEGLFSFKMNLSKSLDENLDDLKKLTNAFNQSGETLGTKSEATILINSIHDPYKEVRSAIKYGRENVSTESIINALRCKDLELKIESKNYEGGESLYRKGRTSKKETDLTTTREINKTGLL